jgi:hypothetical protein
MEKTLTENERYSSADRDRLCRLVFLLIFFTLLYALASHTLLHQLQQPVMKYPYVDLTYWLMHWLQIPDLLAGNATIAWTFDVLLFISCIACFLYPQKNVLIILFVLLYFCYFITFNTFGTHHTNPKLGILFIALPFMVRNNRSFNYLWQALRYFLLFAYSCAFYWKVVRLGWLQHDQGLLIMQKNLVEYLYFNPNTILAGMYTWLLQRETLLQVLFITGCMLEGVFITGFFTKKYDRYLFIGSILLPMGFWFMADAFFVELLLLSLTLLNLHRILAFIRRLEPVRTPH